MKLKKSFPFYLQLASYFYPITIEKSSDPYYLELVLSKNKLILNSKNANQSNDSLKLAFHECFYRMGIYKRALDHLLVIGLGLGSVVDLLQKNGDVKKITSYENNPQILAWLSKYYYCTDINIISNSAKDLETPNIAYDLILVDLFIDNETPDFLNEISFWVQLKAMKSQNGILIWNTLIQNPPKVDFSLSDFFTGSADIHGGNKMWYLTS